MKLTILSQLLPSSTLYASSLTKSNSFETFSSKSTALSIVELSKNSATLFCTKNYH